MNIKFKTEPEQPESDVIVNKFHLLIGFEINNIDTAFVKKKIGLLKQKIDFVQILSGYDESGEPIGDYGHAFFYTTKNEVVESFFSFGPADDGKQKQKLFNSEQNKAYADGYANSRPSTGNFKVSEVASIFRFEITASEFNKITSVTNKVLKKIENGKSYRALTNDTCAEEAEDILDDVIKSLPDGKGYVENNGIVFPFKVVNPYMWAKQFYDKYKVAYIYPEYPEKGKGKEMFDLDGEEPYSVEPWLILKGEKDPLSQKGYYIKVLNHGVKSE